MGKLLVLATATVALNVFVPRAHAQDYLANGHAASKAEAQFLTSYSAPAGEWRVDGYGIARVADEHPTPVAQTAGQKCWYVLDVKFCDSLEPVVARQAATGSPALMSSRAIALLASGISQHSPQWVLISMP